MLVLSILACAPTTSSTSTDAADATTATADTAVPIDLSDWVEAGAGSWVGTVADTPIGGFPFAITFEPSANGLSGSATNGDFSLSFTYEVDDQGRWTLTETGRMPPYFEQTKTLVPSRVDGSEVVWVTPDDPEYLVVVVEHPGDAVHMDVELRGQRHARFELERAP